MSPVVAASLCVLCLLLGAALGYLFARSRTATTSAMRDEFRALASEVVRDSRREIAEIASDKVGTHVAEASRAIEARRDEVDALIGPIRTQLERLAEQSHLLERERVASYRTLDQKVSALDAHTQALNHALAGSSQARGVWGEVTLRRILELAGLERHVTYTEQTAVDATRRPDVLVHLPGDRVLPIDAKAPGAAFLRAAELPAGAERDAAMLDHARAVKEQIKQLSRKDYSAAVSGTFDHVVLFLPNEAMASAAFDTDPELLAGAMQQRVLIATPVTLLALLRTVELYWRQHEVDENAKQIGVEARELVERVATFSEHVAAMGAGLERATAAFQSASRSYDKRVLPQARRLSALGVVGKREFQPMSRDDRT